MGQFEGQILPSHLLLRNPLSLKLLSPFSSWTRKESPAQVEKKGRCIFAVLSFIKSDNYYYYIYMTNRKGLAVRAPSLQNFPTIS